MRAAELLDPDPQDIAVMAGYPRVPWLEPLQVHSPTGERGYACRVCVARYGLRGRDIPRLPKTASEVLEHLVAFHHLTVP